MPDLQVYPSNFELINLAYESPMDDEICWLVAQYCFYVYEQKKKKAHNYTINVDKLRRHLIGLYAQNQKSQNVLAHIPFQFDACSQSQLLLFILCIFPHAAIHSSCYLFCAQFRMQPSIALAIYFVHQLKLCMQPSIAHVLHITDGVNAMII